MKVLITGGKGQLGTDLQDVLGAKSIDFLALDVDAADITDREGFRKVATEYAPDVIVHCAAYTAVDKAEEQLDIVRKINVDGTLNVALAAKELHAKMVYISTDYVFPGTGENFYEVDDKPDPISAYGETKYEGELEVMKTLKDYFIIRISWAFGVHGHNFVKTMLRLGQDHDSIRVVNDQFGSPTYTHDLAELISSMIITDKYGIYHATNEGICSWSDFAAAIFEIAGLSTTVIPVTSEEYGAQAKRPKNSRLSKKSLDEAGFKRLPQWRIALEDMISKL